MAAESHSSSPARPTGRSCAKKRSRTRRPDVALNAETETWDAPRLTIVEWVLALIATGRLESAGGDVLAYKLRREAGHVFDDVDQVLGAKDAGVGHGAAVSETLGAFEVGLRD